MGLPHQAPHLGKAGHPRARLHTTARTRARTRVDADAHTDTLSLIEWPDLQVLAHPWMTECAKKPQVDEIEEQVRPCICVCALLRSLLCIGAQLSMIACIHAAWLLDLPVLPFAERGFMSADSQVRTYLQQVKQFVSGQMKKADETTLLGQMFQLKPGTDKMLMEVHNS